MTTPDGFVTARVVAKRAPWLPFLPGARWWLRMDIGTIGPMWIPVARAVFDGCRVGDDLPIDVQFHPHPSQQAPPN